MLDKCLIEDVNALTMPAADHVTLWVNAILFLIIGSFVFDRFTNIAKKERLIEILLITGHLTAFE